jgi:uncharacterized protein
MSIDARIASALGLQPAQVGATLALLDDGNTVPFVARYRKERTGNLDEVQLRAVEAAAARLRKLDDRRDAILASLKEQGVQLPELERQVREAATVTDLEDLYAPYRPKRTSRGDKALAAGLGPIADAIERGLDAGKLASALRTTEFPDIPAVLAGGADIVAERVASEAAARRFARETVRDGTLVVKKRRGAEPNPTFADYLDFQARVGRLRPHQVLAIRRGEAEKALSAGIETDDARAIRTIVDAKRARGLYADAIADAWSRMLQPAAEREIRAELDLAADDHAIGVFAINLKNLLLQPPMPARRVLGVDPGFRTGCKLAAVDASGAVLGTDVVYLHDGRAADAPKRLAGLLTRYGIDVVAIGNGTGSTEAQHAVAAAIVGTVVRYTLVDEAGASVYSASDLARAELPDLDVTFRGAVSIARRLQDPLAELVKIDPKAIGVGLYQHDVDQARLAATLDAVVTDAVNAVGVDLATASERLLTYVAGIGPTLAARIVAQRTANGPFRTRSQLRDVKGIGARTFEQAAGFLRIFGGPEPLDATPIHPESYPAARALRAGKPVDEVAREFGVGRFTLDDLRVALERGGRDARADLPPPELRDRQLTFDDVAVGTKLVGTVRNVVDFGAFVDVGLKHAGLVHVSKLAKGFVKDPHTVVAVGDRVEVTVVSVDRERGRLGLSMVD